MNVEFDSTYPIHLNGIISRDEFQESINKINHALLSFKHYLILIWIVFVLTLSGGITCCVVGGAIAGINHSVTSVFYVLIGVGTGLTTFGSVFFSIGYCFIYSQRITRMRQALAKESMKYSSIPCSWRLDNLTVPFEGYSYYNNRSLGYNVSNISIRKSLFNSLFLVSD